MLVKIIAAAALAATLTSAVPSPSLPERHAEVAHAERDSTSYAYPYEFYVYSADHYKGKNEFLGDQIWAEPWQKQVCLKCRQLNGNVSDKVHSFYFEPIVTQPTALEGFTIGFWHDTKCGGEPLKTYKSPQHQTSVAALHSARAVKVCFFNIGGSV
ncbi:hypothetical protein BV22DRAFT_1130663 [Leucogyrophana mollusca]|uniref:Uncharacterized protein n=1 Tax=Leucogyrophana mollusca TaxID=85980 RepID=A0ACB8BFB2_9AGAM|nr:hypothetical protein BV22DRAFT_1130663 [Leucogyrophana mollusca]